MISWATRCIVGDNTGDSVGVATGAAVGGDATGIAVGGETGGENGAIGPNEQPAVCSVTALTVNFVVGIEIGIIRIIG